MMRALLIIAAFLVSAPPRANTAEAEQAYFTGKTVRMIVGYGPGGGYDAYARMIAPYLGKFLGATILVENQPGAGGLIALNRIYAAPPDGLLMMLVNGTGAAMSQLTEQSGARFDLSRLNFLGTVTVSPRMWMVGPDLPIRTPQDAMTFDRKINWAASGPTDGSSDGASFTCEALKLQCRIVLGYGSSNLAALSVARGEMDSFYLYDTSADSYVKAGSGKVIAAMGRERSRFFPEIATIFEQVQLNADQQWLFDFRTALDNLGRILVAAPDTPPARLAYLRAALKASLTDPGLVAEAERTHRYINYLDAETTRRTAVTIVTGITPEQKKMVRDIVAKAR